MKHKEDVGAEGGTGHSAGLVRWLLKPLLKKLRGVRHPGPRLELLERITLAPRQSLALVEAEGRRFLVATSAEGGPAFYALDSGARTAFNRISHQAPHRAMKVSW